VVLFGEAEKGEFRQPYLCQCLEDLASWLGNPPDESQGILFAIQMLLFNYPCLFFRVENEGFSTPDYLKGLRTLQEHALPISALAMPGVGDAKIIDASLPICLEHQSQLLISEADLYDYLTDR